jgi:integrase
MSVRLIAPGKHQGQYRDAAGKRHTKVFATKTAARKWADDGAAAVRAGTHRNPRAGRLLFREWHARWTAARVVEDATRYRDGLYAKTVLARWGDMPLDAITRMEVQSWVRQLEQDGRGRTAIGFLHQQVVSVLEAAVGDDLIPSNPARGIRLPREPKGTDRLITLDEEVRLLDAFTRQQDRWMIEVLLDTGLRYGELAGLHGSRVDFMRRELHVVETLTQRGQVKAYPKSAAGQRVIPLEERALLALAGAMEPWGRDGLVFRTITPGRAGRPVVETPWRAHHWMPALGRAGLDDPQPTPHDLRHSYLSRLVAAGVDLKTVQMVAGHESLSTTLRYLHNAPDAGERVRAAVKTLRHA